VSRIKLTGLFESKCNPCGDCLFQQNLPEFQEHSEQPSSFLQPLQAPPLVVELKICDNSNFTLHYREKGGRPVLLIEAFSLG
jgi:hypothetical protein